MAWVKMDDKFPFGPKVKRAALALGKKGARTRVLGVWTWLMGYCNLNETDGFVPDYEVADIDDVNPTAVLEAMAAGEGETPGPIMERVADRKGWQVRNYAEYQPTRAELDAKRKAERERKDAKRKTTLVRADKSRTPPGQIAVPDYPIRPVPIRSEPDPEDKSLPVDVSPRFASPTEKAHRGHAFPDTCAIGKCLMPSQADAFEKQLIANNGGIFPDGANIRQFAGEVVAEWTAAGVPAEDTFKAWQAVFERRMGVRRGSASIAKPQPAYVMDWAEECERLHAGKCGGQYKHGLTMSSQAVPA
jgi:hypothetical protein